jgi:hypothetical protein
MRKIALVFLASVALFSAACGGGSDKKDDASVDANAGAKVNTAAATAAAAKVCNSREAITFAGAAAGAQSAGKDLKSYSEALKDAATVAPSEIKADFTLIANTYGGYIDLVASANGDYMALSQNPEFQEKVQKLSAPDVKTAAEHVTAYFAEHCKG